MFFMHLFVAILIQITKELEHCGGLLDENVKLLNNLGSVQSLMYTSCPKRKWT